LKSNNAVQKFLHIPGKIISIFTVKKASKQNVERYLESNERDIRCLIPGL
jgi:hypothetical protein